jgi:hypothetical protein
LQVALLSGPLRNDTIVHFSIRSFDETPRPVYGGHVISPTGDMYLYSVYLTTLSVAQSVWLSVRELLMGNRSERIWEKVSGGVPEFFCRK